MPGYPLDEGPSVQELRTQDLRNLLKPQVGVVEDNEGKWYSILSRDNPHTKDRMAQLPIDWLPKAFESMFQPTPVFLEHVKTVLNQFEGAFVVGIQSRSFKLDTGQLNSLDAQQTRGRLGLEEWVDRSLDCTTRAVSQLGDLRWALHPPVITSYRKIHFVSPEEPEPPLRYFISTDDPRHHGRQRSVDSL